MESSEAAKYKLSHPEIYREIKYVGCDNIYMVSNWGRVFRKDKGRLVELVLQAGGRYVYLRLDGRSQKVSVGYLVARAFVNNVKLCEEIRHKDGDTTNNTAENIEWCEFAEKLCMVVKKEEKSKEKVRAVLQYDKEGELVRRYASVSEASRLTDISRSKISEVINGRRNSAGGYIWRYAI